MLSLHTAWQERPWSNKNLQLSATSAGAGPAQPSMVVVVEDVLVLDDVLVEV